MRPETSWFRFGQFCLSVHRDSDSNSLRAACRVASFSAASRSRCNLRALCLFAVQTTKQTRAPTAAIHPNTTRPFTKQIIVGSARKQAAPRKAPAGAVATNERTFRDKFGFLAIAWVAENAPILQDPDCALVAAWSRVEHRTSAKLEELARTQDARCWIRLAA